MDKASKAYGMTVNMNKTNKNKNVNIKLSGRKWEVKIF